MQRPTVVRIGLSFKLAIILPLAFTVIMPMTGCPDPPPVTPALPSGPGGSVHGSVVVTVVQRDRETDARIGGSMGEVYLPDFDVLLRDTLSGSITASARTDVFGRYFFPVQPAGDYEIIWKSQNGWAAGVHSEIQKIRRNTAYPMPLEVYAELKTVLAGQLRLADGSVPRHLDAIAGKRDTPTVSAVSSLGATVRKVRANIFGDFVIAGVSAPGTSLRTEWGASSTVTALSPPVLSGLSPIQVLINNFPPRILTLAAIEAGVGIRTAAGGDTIDVVAEVEDLDGDPITYQWRADEQSGTVTPVAPGRAVWKLPNGDGGRRLYLTVHDTNGGYATRSLGITLNLLADRFSGKVIDTNGAVVAGATVEVNALPVTTTPSGAFLIDVPVASRYIMNIRKPGYALFAKVFDKPSNGSTWVLMQTQSTIVDPAQDLVIVDRRPDQQEKNREGMRLRISAGTLVDTAGQQPTGNLTAEIATYDISQQMPGADGALSGGSESIMLSYGAGYANFTDAAGNSYNIAAGQTVEIELPIPASMLATAAPTVDLWSYDETDGYWKQTGTADLDPATGRYRGKIDHLSAVNTDIASTDAACLKVILDSTLAPGTTSLRATYISGPQPFGQTKILPLDDVENVFYRLPANTQIKLELLDKDSLELIDTLEVLEGSTVAPNDTIDTGAALPSGADLWPDPPYSTCKPITVRLNLPSGGPFLELGFSGDGGSLAEAQFYYSVVAPTTADPNTDRETLAEWWAVNGFSATDGTAADAVRQAYMNYNDLGFGRDMYMRKELDGSGNIIRIASFVTNYFDASTGIIGDQNPANADYAQARQADKRVATVCMEYAPIEGDPSGKMVVKFFVYGAGSGAFGPDGGRLNSADLDGFGQKFVPTLCLNCHGGDFARLGDTTLADLDRVDMGSVFREFDAPTFRYPGGVVTLPSGDPIHAFLKGLNELTRDTCDTPTGSLEPEEVRGGAIRELIDGWYLSGGDEQDNTWAPNPWLTSGGAPSNAYDLYRDVFSVSCRTCHVAFSQDAGHSSGITWRTFDGAKNSSGFINFVVCGSNKFMPHANITFKNFWLDTDPHRPTVLKNFSATGWTTPTGPCE